MKLLVRQHLQGMKERGELDVLLPQLLSEIGYEVIHHPRVGGRQAGVDVAAVGPDPDANGERSLLLFVIKSGDVGRADWDGSQQAVRPSLGEVLDDYIPNRIAQQYRDLPVVVCVCMGGEIQEGVRAPWRGFVDRHTTGKLSFREWNGDRLASLILSGVLRQELLAPDHRIHFQKAIALVSEPEASYQHFRNLLDALTAETGPGNEGTTRLRQMMICLWILVGNGFDAENLDAPYRACELALLHAWNAFQQCPESESKQRATRQEILDHVLTLYLSVARKLIVDKIGPHVGRTHALSAAVRSRSALDVNLSLFETLGRIALLGLWHHYIGCASPDQENGHLQKRDEALNLAILMVNANPTLVAPMRDDHQIEIGMLMLLAQACGRLPSVDHYLREVASRLSYRYVLRTEWTTCFRDYRQLARHPVDQSDAYFERSTCGSVLIPFIIVGLERLGAEEELKAFQDVVGKKLQHMTQQVWVPSKETDKVIWRTGTSTGIGIPVPALRQEDGDTSLSNEVDQLALDHTSLQEMEAFRSGLAPLFLTACRHHRLPLPPHLWFKVDRGDGQEQ
jgi:hypothetical protein